MTAELWGAVLSSSIATALVTGFVDYLMKLKEKSINSQNHKEVKRIQVIEHIYQKFQELTLYNGAPTDTQNFMDTINYTTRYITDNGLYIDKTLRRITDDLLDYFKSVARDATTKNYATEDSYIDRIVNYFNK